MRTTAITAALVAAGMLGCVNDDEADSTTAADAVTCSLVGAGAPWWNQTFPEQVRRFHAEFDVTASAERIDAVIGLSDGAAATFAKLAVIVRFNEAGYVDARAGSGYRADTSYPYFAGATYHVRFDVDTAAHTYSVWIAQGAGNTFYTRLANGYMFRTEQAGVARLTNAAAKVDSASGSIQLCGPAVVADVTTGDGCATVTASDGFAALPITDARVVQVLDFSARSSVPSIDAVIGMSAAPARTFSDLATAVRFGTSGNIDVRDGDTYRGDVAQPYDVNDWRFKVIADLTSHTYSVFEVAGLNSLELARQYRFRTQQAGVAHLGYLDLIVDGTPGALKVCGVRAQSPAGVAYTREGDPWVLPLAGGAALMSDDAATTRVDVGGRTLATYGRGGALATDVLGNVFIASVAGNTLTIEKTDASFVSRWRTTQTVLAGGKIVAMAADPAGAVHVGLVTPQEMTVQIFRITAGGTFLSSTSGPGNWVALAGDGTAAVAWQDGPETIRISTWDTSGAVIWQRAFAGAASVVAMAIDPDRGVVFGGQLGGTTDFGGGPIHGDYNDNAGALDGFWVKLARDGSHVASRATGDDGTVSIAASATRIAVSSTYRTQFWYSRYYIYDAAGAPISGGAGPFSDEGQGRGGRIAIGDGGRVWWNFTMMPYPVSSAFPYMVAIDP